MLMCWYLHLPVTRPSIFPNWFATQLREHCSKKIVNNRKINKATRKKTAHRKRNMDKIWIYSDKIFILSAKCSNNTRCIRSMHSRLHSHLNAFVMHLLAIKVQRIINFALSCLVSFMNSIEKFFFGCCWIFMDLTACISVGYHYLNQLEALYSPSTWHTFIKWCQCAENSFGAFFETIFLIFIKNWFFSTKYILQTVFFKGKTEDRKSFWTYKS